MVHASIVPSGRLGAEAGTRPAALDVTRTAMAPQAGFFPWSGAGRQAFQVVILHAIVAVVNHPVAAAAVRGASGSARASFWNLIAGGLLFAIVQAPLNKKDSFHARLTAHLRKENLFSRRFSLHDLQRAAEFKSWSYRTLREAMQPLVRAGVVARKRIRERYFFVMDAPPQGTFESPDDPILWKGLRYSELPESKAFRGSGDRAIENLLIPDAARAELTRDYAAWDNPTKPSNPRLGALTADDCLQVYMLLRGARKAYDIYQRGFERRPQTVLELQRRITADMHRDEFAGLLPEIPADTVGDITRAWKCPSANDLLAALQAHPGFHVLRTPAQIQGALRWLESRGFPIRQENGGYVVRGIGFDTPSFNTDVTTWKNDDLRREWLALRAYGDHPAAIARRVRVLLAVHDIPPTRLSASLRQLLATWEKRPLNADKERRSFRADFIDQGVERLAFALGVEPILLLTGYSRSHGQAEVHRRLADMAHAGARFMALRRLRGLSRATVCALPGLRGVRPKMLTKFEMGRSSLDALAAVAPDIAQRLAQAVRVDPSLIVRGRRYAEALRTCSPQQLFHDLPLVYGLSRSAFARRLGITRAYLKKWSVQGMAAFTVDDLVAAAEGRSDPQALRKRAIHYQLSTVSQERALAALYAVKKTELFTAAEALSILGRSSMANLRRLLEQFEAQGILKRRERSSHRFAFEIAPAAARRLATSV